MHDANRLHIIITIPKDILLMDVNDSLIMVFHTRYLHKIWHFLDPSIFRIYSYCNSGNWKQNTRSSSSYVCTRWGGKWKSTTVASTSRTPRKVVFWIQTLIPRKKTRVRPRDPLASFVVDFYEPLEKWHQNKLHYIDGRAHRATMYPLLDGSGGSCWVRKLGHPRLLFGGC